MKRILFVAPLSHLLNGPEAMVNAKHIKLLTDMGCRVDLVCRSIRANQTFYPKTEKCSFVEGVNSIHEVCVETRWNVRTLWRHIKTYLKTGYVYKAADWAFEAIKICEELINVNKYDYIFTKDYPSEIVGVYFAKKYGVKWIPTWNDPYMWKKYPPPYGQGAQYKEMWIRRKLIRDIGKYSYIHIFPSDRLRDYMLSYMIGMQPDRCVVMPHILIKSIVGKSEYSLKNDTLRIIHAGSIGNERNPDICLNGLKCFIEKHPDKKVEITFLGISDSIKDALLMPLIKKYKLENHVKVLPPILYQESLSAILDYDVCLLIEAPCKEGIFLPSKIVDYLQNEKPILALSPTAGVMKDLYIKNIVDYYADNKNLNSVVSAFECIHADYLLGKLHKQKDISDFLVPSVTDLHFKKIFI